MSDLTPIVFVVHHDASVRQAIKELLDSAEVCSKLYASEREFAMRPPTPGPCCLVLDCGLPGAGLDGQACISMEQTTMPVIFVGDCDDARVVVRAIRAGAVDFLPGPIDADELMSAIRAAIDRSREALVNEASLRALRANHARLSRREREVMDLVTEGRLNKQIGWQLGISEITVKVHRGQVMRKMQARSLAQLIDMARRLGIAGTRPAAVGLSRAAKADWPSVKVFFNGGGVPTDFFAVYCAEAAFPASGHRTHVEAIPKQVTAPGVAQEVERKFIPILEASCADAR